MPLRVVLLLAFLAFVVGIDNQNITTIKRRVQGSASDIVGFWAMTNGANNSPDCKDYSTSGNTLSCNADSYNGNLQIGDITNALGITVDISSNCKLVGKTSVANLPTGSYTMAMFLNLRQKDCKSRYLFSFGNSAGIYTGFYFNSQTQFAGYFAQGTTVKSSATIAVSPTNNRW
jgi:hypothetical protein